MKQYIKMPVADKLLTLPTRTRGNHWSKWTTFFTQPTVIAPTDLIKVKKHFDYSRLKLTSQIKNTIAAYFMLESNEIEEVFLVAAVIKVNDSIDDTFEWRIK